MTPTIITGTNKIELNLETIKAMVQHHLNASLLREPLIVTNVVMEKEQYGGITFVITVEPAPPATTEVAPTTETVVVPTVSSPP